MSAPSSPKGHVLVILATLMVGSAVIRTAVQAGPAVARETATAVEPQSDGVLPTSATGDGFHKMLQAFRNREDRIAAEEERIEARMQELQQAEVEIERKLGELKEAEDQLSATLARVDGASETDLARLTAVYERMKPKETAELFAEMEPGFAAGFLARMKPEAAAGILAGLDPQTAYSISVVLAGRNALVPKN